MLRAIFAHEVLQNRSTRLLQVSDTLQAHCRWKSSSLLSYEHFGVSPREATCSALVVHGLLGHGRNWRTFCKRLAQAADSDTSGAWSIVTVDLRNHGKSAQQEFDPPHNLAAAAKDILHLVQQVFAAETPPLIIGHSLGGKVVLSLVKEIFKGTKNGATNSEQSWRLPREVWVLDSIIGRPVKTNPEAGKEPTDVDRVLAEIDKVQLPVPSRETLYKQMEEAGFTLGLRQWMGSNLVPAKNKEGGLEWIFNLDGVKEMYRSYYKTDYWPTIRDGMEKDVTFQIVRGELSDRWSDKAIKELDAALKDAPADKLHLHLLPKAGHWVHADNPTGLLDMLIPSLKSIAKSASKP